MRHKFQCTCLMYCLLFRPFSVCSRCINDGQPDSNVGLLLLAYISVRSPQRMRMVGQDIKHVAYPRYMLFMFHTCQQNALTKVGTRLAFTIVSCETLSSPLAYAVLFSDSPPRKSWCLIVSSCRTPYQAKFNIYVIIWTAISSGIEW